MDNKMLTAALAYADMDWHVFPVREKDGSPYKNAQKQWETPRAKSPYGGGGGRGGLHTATKDKSEIIKMWKKYPNAAIGVNCGLSNLFVIDIDNHRGAGALATFMRMGIPHTGAWQGLTPSHGLHIIFAGMGRSTTNKKTQIDTRGKNGYIILPPSYIISEGKKRYYRKIGKWLGKPAPVPKNCFSKLGLVRSETTTPKTYKSSDTSADTIKKAKNLASRLDVSLAYDYQTWFRIGMSLYSIGEDGFEIWSEWTEKYFEEKPDSRRTRDLAKKWDTFSGTRVGIATYFGYAYGSYKKWKK